MDRTIALLRGVNVGGKNQISMPALKAAFEAARFSQVSTYINSGNVIFSSEEADAALLGRRCRDLILDRFGLDIAVAVLSVRDLREALEKAPDWWGSDPKAKHNAIFVIAPARTEEVLAAVGPAKENYERVAAHGQVIFWSAPIETFSKTRWSKIVSHAAYSQVTIRNAATARKLAEPDR